MEIRILEFVEGAKKAKGVTVIIDVFRAFSTACYAYDAGASRVIACGSIDAAFNLSKKYRNAVLAGEREERKPEGFDFGNSPTEILKADLNSKTVILTTTAGTNGLVNAGNNDIIMAAGLVNACATAEYIKSLSPGTVSLVAMGYRATQRAEEDIICAELIADRLNDGVKDFTVRTEALRTGGGNRFFLPQNLEFSPPTDFFLCTMTCRFNFALRAERRPDGNIDLLKADL